MPKQRQLFVKPIEQSGNAFVQGNWGQKLSLLEPQVDTLPCWAFGKASLAWWHRLYTCQLLLSDLSSPPTKCWASTSGSFEQAKPVFDRIFFRGQALSSTYGRNCLSVSWEEEGGEGRHLETGWVPPGAAVLEAQVFSVSAHWTGTCHWHVGAELFPLHLPSASWP